MEDTKLRHVQIFVSVFDIILKAIVFIVGIIIGVSQFNKQQLSNKNIEYRKEIWQKELEHYQNICTATGKILTSITPVQIDLTLFNEGKKDFLIQYWGSALFYGDDSTKTKLMNFREQVETIVPYKNNYSNGEPEFDRIDAIRTAGVELINSYEKRFKETKNKLTND